MPFRRDPGDRWLWQAMLVFVLVGNARHLAYADATGEVAKSTVRITVRGQDQSGRSVNNTGSGFFVDSTGRILTAFHVVGRHPDGALISWNDLPGGRRNPTITVERVGANRTLQPILAAAAVKQKDVPLDIALLELAGSEYPTIKCELGAVRDNTRLQAVGWRAGRDSYDPLSGTLAPYDGNDGGRRRIANMAANHGNSGGPVFDDLARVVGLITSGRNKILNPGSSETFATFLSDVPQVWLSCRQPKETPPVPPAPDLERKLREVIAQLRNRNPDYSRMEPVLAEAVRSQLGTIGATLERLGPIKSVTILGAQYGSSSYRVEFKHGSQLWSIASGASGRLSILYFQMERLDSDIRFSTVSTENILRGVIADIRRGEPNYHEMSPQLATLLRAQLPKTREILNLMGPLDQITSIGLQQGMDAYRVEFGNGTQTWLIAVTADHQIAGLIWRQN